jgi:bifunctional non-homologous end joining protein LigD
LYSTPIAFSTVSLENAQCLSNLPDKRPGAWWQGITAEKMKECQCLEPSAVAEVEFAESTPDDRLRHGSFLGLRRDKKPRDAVKET